MIGNPELGGPHDTSDESGFEAPQSQSGEIPVGVPGEVVFPVKGMRLSKRGVRLFRKERREGKLGEKVDGLLETGKAVGAALHLNEVVLYVGKHRKEITAGVVGLGFLAGGIVFLRQRNKKKNR